MKMTAKQKPGKDYIGVGGGALILNKRKEILLMQRSKNAKNEAGWWSQPGGAVDYGETMMAAVKRELKEELGIKIKMLAVLPHTDHILKKEGQHWLAVSYVASVVSGTLEIKEPEKCDALGWFSLDELPKKLTRTTREAVQNYLQKKFIKL